MARGKGRRGTYWDGIQLPRTAVTTAGLVLVLVDTTAQEFMPSTLVRVRGQLSFTPSADTINEVRAKMLYVEVNDAQAMTGDHAAIDTHEEDIAARQLWAAQHAQPASALRAVNNIEIDVKAKLKLVPSGKMLLVLLIQATTATRTDVTANLRCLLMHG